MRFRPIGGGGGSSSGGGLTVGTTTITSGTNGRVLFDNSGVVGEYAITGTGSVAMSDSPVFTTNITTPAIVSTLGLSVTTTVRTSGVTPYYRNVTPADTGQTASTESIGEAFGGSSANPPVTVTRTWATGAYAGSQRENVFTAPTYNTAAASSWAGAILTTVAITAAPVIGGNISGSPNSYALWVQGGSVLLAGGITSPGPASGLGANNEFFGAGAGTTVAANCASNTLVGKSAGANISNGSSNVFVGSSCGSGNTLGTSTVRNTMMGAGAGINLVSGAADNTMLGSTVGQSVSGNRNTLLGSTTGTTTTALTTGSDNTLLGYGAITSVNSATFQTVIGSGAVGTANNQVTLGRPATDFVNCGIISSAGDSRVTGDVTNATATMANITGLSATLIAGRKYCGELVIFADDGTAVDGLQFDFDGGAATATSFVAGIAGTPIGATAGVVYSTALATDLTITTATTGTIAYIIKFSIVVNAAGTFIPRFSQVAHTTGTATIRLGSYMTLRDSPT